MKKNVLVGIAVLFSFSGFTQKLPPPEETEVWTPVPAVVDPHGKNGAPSDAIVLLENGFSAWTSQKGGQPKWFMDKGVITVKPGTGEIRTKQAFGSVQLHIEWRTPPVDSAATGQGRGNSGIFLMGKYEVQVLDSYNNKTYSNGQASSIYKQHIPLVNAMNQPLEWQYYDIIFTAPEFSEKGKVVKPARVTVLHNGVLVQNNVEILGETVYQGAPVYKLHDNKLPLSLQDHGNMVSFRNIWIREL